MILPFVMVVSAYTHGGRTIGTQKMQLHDV